MDCLDCNVEIEPRSYPEGKCPSCGATYTLPDSEFNECENCGDPMSGDGIEGECLDCHLADGDESGA